MATVDAQVKKADITTARCRKKAARNRFGDRKLLVGSARTSKTSPESFPGPVRSRLNPTLLTSLARLGSIPVPGKSAYPLRCPILLCVVMRSDGVSIQPLGDSLGHMLTAHGPTLEAALENFGRRFDLLVEANRAVPPHVRTPENQRIAGILDHLVDWYRYEQDNPLAQSMWGQVRARLADGSLLVFWLSGPNEARNREAVLPGRDVSRSLSEIHVNDWFYGSAKCFPDRVEWIDLPERAPAPDDMEARKVLFDNLPKEFADEPGCWPLKAE